MANVKFKILSAPERLAMVRDYVRDAEATYYRLTLAPTTDPSRDERLVSSKERLDQLHKEYDALAKEAEGE